MIGDSLMCIAIVGIGLSLGNLVFSHLDERFGDPGLLKTLRMFYQILTSRR